MTSGNDQERDSTDQRIEAVLHLAEQLAADDVRDGYTHLGAATSGAFRFKWVARLQTDGRFVVEETVGSGNVAVRSHPLAKDEVLAYIDARQRKIQAKVDEVKRELAGLQGIGEDEPPVEAERDPVQMYDEIRRMLRERK